MVVIFKMSSKTEAVDVEADEIMFCASCGTAGVDNIKLKKCNAATSCDIAV